MPRASDPRHRREKKRGVVLGAAGLCVILAVGLVFKAVGVAALSLGDWLACALLTVAVQALVWLIPHLGWDVYLRWDPHFLYVPMIAALLLIESFIYILPEARHFLFIGFYVSLLFMAGLEGFRGVLFLSALMTLGYLIVIEMLLRRGFPIALSVELTMAGLLLVVGIYAGFVLERLHLDRKEMRQLRQELASLALTDPLTNLPNRRHFEGILRSELARIGRYGGVCSVAMVDVDHFKSYNDHLGHLAGDEVLQELAAVLREHLRVSDVAARYGGEEFAVAMVNTPLADAVVVVERLRKAVEDHPFDREGILPRGTLTISAGIASSPDHGNDYEGLMLRSDKALYEAKEAGRNRIALARAAAEPSSPGVGA